MRTNEKGPLVKKKEGKRRPKPKTGRGGPTKARTNHRSRIRKKQHQTPSAANGKKTNGQKHLPRRARFPGKNQLTKEGTKRDLEGVLVAGDNEEVKTKKRAVSFLSGA